MPASVTFEWVNDRSFIAHFKRVSDAGMTFIVQAITALTLQDEALVKKKLTNDVLNVQTGNLRRSIFSNIEVNGSSVTGTIASSGDVKYAAIHEYGGVISHPGGTAYAIIAGQGATWVSNAAAESGVSIAGRTRPHQIPMPERSYLRSSLAEMQPVIERKLTEAINRALQVN